jgi:hypothetical protein
VAARAATVPETPVAQAVPAARPVLTVRQGPVRSPRQVAVVGSARPVSATTDGRVAGAPALVAAAVAVAAAAAGAVRAA